MSEFLGLLRVNASRWREGHQEHAGGVVLIWKGQVYGWKDSLRDASQERPGAYAVDEAGHVFIAEGGDDDIGAKCWASVEPDLAQKIGTGACMPTTQTGAGV